MTKKILSLLAASAIAITTLQAQPGQMQKPQQAQMQKKKRAKGVKSVFLIQRGLPHYSMLVKKMWNDETLALTPEQKRKLEAIRNETMRQIGEIAPEVAQLRKKIVRGTKNGLGAETLYADVDRLATLKAKATKIQLDCIEKTRAVLTPAQIAYIDSRMKQHRKKRQRPKNLPVPVQ
ncbi:hypothetical protein [Hydrogenimonas sp.]